MHGSSDGPSIGLRVLALAHVARDQRQLAAGSSFLRSLVRRLLVREVADDRRLRPAMNTRWAPDAARPACNNALPSRLNNAA